MKAKTKLDGKFFQRPCVGLLHPRIHVTVACGGARWSPGKCWLCDLLGRGGAKVILGIIETNYSHTNIILMTWGSL